MKLVQAMAGARHGGAEAFFVRLALGLDRAGVKQRLLIRPEPARAHALGNIGGGLVFLTFGGWFDLVTAYRFQAEVNTFRPDIVLTWMNRATRFCPPKRGHRFVHVGTPRGYYDPKYYRRCDYLVCATADIANFYIRRGWPAERVRQIPNFAARRTMPPVPRAELETPEDVPLLLALGRLHQNKGFDVLLEALALLPDHWLWLGGEGPLAAKLRNQAERLGVASRVRFLGWREDTPALLVACDIFVCSSRHEPFGNIIIEAWAQKVPVVAAASEGPRHLIRSGHSGVLVPLENAKALAEAIRALGNDTALARSLAESGHNEYLLGYTEEKVVARYVEFLESIIAREAG